MEAPKVEPESADPAESSKPNGEAPVEPAVIEAKHLIVGEMLPEISAALETDESLDSAKKTLTLSDIVKASNVIIFVFPRANTPGCTNQATGFRDNMAAVKAAGYQVIGLSADKPKTQASWKVKNTLPFPLLYDHTMETITALGANKGAKGIARSHVVVEKGGKILQAQYNIKPKDSVSAAVLQATGKAAIPPPKATRRPTFVIEEYMEDDEPPPSRHDEPPSGKRRSKPTAKKVEAEQDALEVGPIEDEGESEEDEDEDAPRKRGRGRM